MIYTTKVEGYIECSDCENTTYYFIDQKEELHPFRIGLAVAKQFPKWEFTRFKELCPECLDKRKNNNVF